MEFSNFPHFLPKQYGTNSIIDWSRYTMTCKSIVRTVTGTDTKDLCLICLERSSNCRQIQEKCEINHNLFTSSPTIAELMSAVLGNEDQSCLSANVCQDCLQRLLGSYILLTSYKINTYILKSCIQELHDIIPKDQSPMVVQGKGQEKCIKLHMTLRKSVPYLDHDTTNPCSDKVNQKNKNKLTLGLNSKECSMCAENFESGDDLIEHQKIHPSDTTHICRKDGHIFKTYHALKRHMKRCHGHKNNLICPKCGKLFSRTVSLNRHLLVHSELKLKCQKCQKQFSNRILLKSHSKTHELSKKSAVCETCGKMFKSAELLKSHTNSHKTKECPYCKKVLKTHTHFKYHINKHETGVGRQVKYRTIYKCYSCEYKSYNKKTLEAHINKIHLNIRPYVCNVCEKSFYKEGNLIEHSLVHTKSFSETCKQCGETFVSKKSLAFHSKLHSGERPYPCDLCSQAFITAGRRLDHKKRKHFEKPEKCQICNKMFSLKRELTRHISTAHK